jgi:cation diffusion facilitator CzcD-associated flavoprotein CzcO
MHMEKTTNLLIIGAGPYGLAMAAYARHLGVDHVVVGMPMDFWKANTPKGMYLRSASEQKPRQSVKYGITYTYG